MKEYHVSPKTLPLWRIRLIIICLILIVIGIMLTIKYKFVLYITVAVAFIFCMLIFWYLPRLFKNCRIKIDNRAVILKIGVIFKTTHVFPTFRLIYSQTFTTPISKLMKLSGLVLKAARHRVFIPELSVEDAEEIMTLLTRSGEDEI